MTLGQQVKKRVSGCENYRPWWMMDSLPSHEKTIIPGHSVHMSVRSVVPVCSVSVPCSDASPAFIIPGGQAIDEGTFGYAFIT
jgi:hypothetical protein